MNEAHFISPTRTRKLDRAVHVKYLISFEAETELQDKYIIKFNLDGGCQKWVYENEEDRDNELEDLISRLRPWALAE